MTTPTTKRLAPSLSTRVHNVAEAVRCTACSGTGVATPRTLADHDGHTIADALATALAKLGVDHHDITVRKAVADALRDVAEGRNETA